MRTTIGDGLPFASGLTSALVEMVFDLITGYSVFPLRLLTAIGVVASVGGFAATFGFAVYRFAVGAGVSKTVSAFALVFALLAVLLLLVAMIVEQEVEEAGMGRREDGDQRIGRWNDMPDAGNQSAARAALAEATRARYRAPRVPF